MDNTAFQQKLRNAFLVFLGWCVLTGLYATYDIVSILSADEGDLYAMTWDFQLLMFAIFRLPYLVMILLVLIAVVLVLPPRQAEKTKATIPAKM